MQTLGRAAGVLHGAAPRRAAAPVSGWAGVALCGALLRWAAPPGQVSRALRSLVFAPRSSFDGGGLVGTALPLCGAAAWLLFGWSVAVLTLVGFTRLARCQRPARWLLRLLLPGGSGRLVGGLLGLALVATPSPAVASPSPTVSPTDAPHLDLDWPTGPNPMPTAGPSVAPTPSLAPTPEPSTTPSSVTSTPSGAPSASSHLPNGTNSGAESSVLVTVRRGDTLWGLAARQLLAEGTRPTARAVAVCWPRWWVANRRLIGTDPDLIRPGQRLFTP